MQNMINKAPGGRGSAAVSFSDDEDATQYSGSISTATGRGKKGTLPTFKSARDVSEASKTSSRGRGRGRGRGASTLKQTTLDASTMFRRPERCVPNNIIDLCLMNIILLFEFTILVIYVTNMFTFFPARSASVTTSASVRSIAVDEEDLNSDSGDEPVQYGINELHNSSV